MGSMLELLNSPEARLLQRKPRPGDSEAAIMSGRGDTKIVWNPENEVEVNAIRKMFDELKKAKYNAYHVTGKDGDKGELMKEFDPKAGRVIFAPAFAGG